MNSPNLDREKTYRDLFPILGKKVIDKHRKEILRVVSAIIEIGETPDTLQVFYRIEAPDGLGWYCLEKEFDKKYELIKE